MKFIKLLSILVITAFFLTSCGGKLPGADARKYPPDPEERVKRNLEEGRGFRISNIGKQGSGTFEFASYNELYGALGGLLILMVYLWLNSNILLLGFELNAVLARIKNEVNSKTE